MNVASGKTTTSASFGALARKLSTVLKLEKGVPEYFTLCGTFVWTAYTFSLSSSSICGGRKEAIIMPTPLRAHIISSNFHIRWRLTFSSHDAIMTFVNATSHVRPSVPHMESVRM